MGSGLRWRHGQSAVEPLCSQAGWLAVVDWGEEHWQRGTLHPACAGEASSLAGIGIPFLDYLAIGQSEPKKPKQTAPIQCGEL